MTFVPESRRRFLSTLAAAGTVGVAGCPAGGPTYRFTTNAAGAELSAVVSSYHTDDLAGTRARYAIDYPAEYKRSVVDELLAGGTVEVTQLQLAPVDRFGTTTRPAPRFVSADGAYYLVVETDREEATATQWAFYLDLAAEAPPSSATVVPGPPSSLSGTDREIVRKAMASVAATRGDPLDADEYEFPHRGVRFHEHLDPDASDLVPDPPFDYVEAGGNQFAARADRGEAPVTRYRFAARPVGTSTDELHRFFEREFVDARFGAGELPGAAADVLDAATDPGGGNAYSETGPMSDGLTTVTERLGMAAYMPADAASVEFRDARFRYDGRWYEGDLTTR